MVVLEFYAIVLREMASYTGLWHLGLWKGVDFLLLIQISSYLHLVIASKPSVGQVASCVLGLWLTVDIDRTALNLRYMKCFSCAIKKSPHQPPSCSGRKAVTFPHGWGSSSSVWIIRGECMTWPVQGEVSPSATMLNSIACLLEIHFVLKIALAELYWKQSMFSSYSPTIKSLWFWASASPSAQCGW